MFSRGLCYFGSRFSNGRKQPMDSFNLRVFVEVVDRGSVAATARACSMTVAGVSMLIGRLEGHYRVKLIAREGRTVVPTTAGQILHEHAKELMAAERRLEQDIDFAREIDRGWVRIGTIRRIASTFLPPILSRFKALHPDINVRVEIGTEDQIATLLQNRRVEFACLHALQGDELINTPLYVERLVIVTAPDNAPAETSTVSAQEILRRPFVMAGRRSGWRRRTMLEQALGRSRIIVTHEVDDQEALKAAVRDGVGWGLLPQTLAESDLRSGRLVEVCIDGISLAQEVCLIQRMGAYLTTGAKALIREIQDSSH